MIYSLKCPCGKTYIGQTARPIKIRFSEHKSQIMRYKLEKEKEMGQKEESKWKETGVARHFREMSHNVYDLRWKIIKEVYGKDSMEIKRRLLQREVHWIFSIEWLSPKGLSEECNWHACY